MTIITMFDQYLPQFLCDTTRERTYIERGRNLNQEAIDVALYVGGYSRRMSYNKH